MMREAGIQTTDIYKCDYRLTHLYLTGVPFFTFLLRTNKEEMIVIIKRH